MSNFGKMLIKSVREVLNSEHEYHVREHLAVERQMKESTVRYEMHADGVRELDECPFCPPKEPCQEPHCPYTKDEQ
jgi:hypothetical protein